LERIGVVVELAPGTHERAEELLAEGPPFELAESGFARHTVFVAEDLVVFVFEGENVERQVSALADHPITSAALSRWAPILAGTPRIAREVFAWTQSA